MSLDKDLEIINEKLKNTNLRKSQRRKLEAVKYYLEKMEIKEIKEKVGVSIRSIQRYIKEYKNTGIYEIINEKNSKVKISSDDMSKIKEYINKSPIEFRFAVDEWNCDMLKRFLKADLKIKVSKEYCRKILCENEYYGKNNREEDIIRKKIEKIINDKKNSIWYLDKLYIGKRKLFSKTIDAYFLISFNQKNKIYRYQYFVDHGNRVSKEKIVEQIRIFVSNLVKEDKENSTYIIVNRDRYFSNAFREQRFKKKSRRRILYVNEQFQNSKLREKKKTILRDNKLIDNNGSRGIILNDKLEKIEKYMEEWDLH